jgi:hypothetical protein
MRENNLFLLKRQAGPAFLNIPLWLCYRYSNNKGFRAVSVMRPKVHATLTFHLSVQLDIPRKRFAAIAKVEVIKIGAVGKVLVFPGAVPGILVVRGFKNQITPPVVNFELVAGIALQTVDLEKVIDLISIG